MTPPWDAATVRARGLTPRLLDAAAWRALAQAPDLAAFGARLEGAAAPPEADVAALERRIRARAAALLARLARWLGPHPDLVAIAFDDEDRRAVQGLVRGAAAGLAAERRLDGLVPTPTLPARVLETLAAQATPAAVAAQLAAFGHPFGPPLLAPLAGDPPDLTRAELALARAAAERAARAVRHGPRALRRFVADGVDLANLRAAVALAAGESELDPAEAFLPGGSWLTAGRAAEAARSGSAVAALAHLARAAASGSLRAVLERAAADPARLDDELLAWQLARAERERKLDPLGPASLLAFLLAVRLETIRLRRLLWAIALGAPPEARAALAPVPA